MPGAAAMQKDYRDFQTDVTALLARSRLDAEDLTHSDYMFAVRDWIELRVLVG